MNETGGEWDRELDELLRAVAVGELAEEDPRVAAALARSPEFARRLASHRRIRANFERQAEVLRALQSDPAEPAEERILERFAEHVRPPLRNRGRFLWLALVAAAAVLFMLLTREFAKNGEPALPDDQGEVLDEGGGVELLEPLPGAREVVRFAWRPSPDPRVLLYELSVRVDDASAGLVLRVQTPETTFSPTIPLPRTLRWNVQPLDASGLPVGRPASARVSY